MNKELRNASRKSKDAKERLRSALKISGELRSRSSGRRRKEKRKRNKNWKNKRKESEQRRAERSSKMTRNKTH